MKIRQVKLQNEMARNEMARNDYAAFSRVASTRLALPGTRLFVPMSSVAYTNPQALDISGNGNHLTNNNTATFGSTDLISHVTLNGTTQSLSKADGGAANWADITGTETYIDAAARGLTIYSWVRFDGAAAADEHIAAKWLSTGNQKSYRLYRTGAGTLRAIISVDGAANFITTTTDTLAATTWHFTVLQYDPSTELSAWINNEKVSNIAAVPASIFDSTSVFELGSVNGGALSFMAGKESMVSLCASFHSDAIIKAVFQQERALFGV